MAENIIESDGARIWTVTQGHGIPILLCNGGPGCCDYLEPVASMIDDISQVIRFEQRGCGRSDSVRPYDIKTCIADIESIREFYNIEQWVVGGHSWGPDLAIAYAITHPKRILGLLGIAGGVLNRDRAWHEQYHHMKDTVGEVEPDYQFPPNMEVNRDLNASWSEFVHQPQVLSKIASLEIPALFVYGEKDIRPSWPVQQTASLLPAGRFVLIEDAAHVIWLTHSAELRGSLRGFIREIINIDASG